MSLSIVAAKDIEQAIELLASRPRKAVKDHLAEEPEGVGNFLYDFRAAFTNYQCYERYQQIIEDYNSEQNRATIEKTFMDLMDLANSMDQEEQRYVREGFSSDEELSLYDLLFSENLSKQDIQKIKQVAVDLLAKVKAKIAELDHWTDKQETKAAVDNLIRDTLWAELPECYDEVSISGYRQKIYEYVYTRYPDVA